VRVTHHTHRWRGGREEAHTKWAMTSIATPHDMSSLKYRCSNGTHAKKMKERCKWPGAINDEELGEGKGGDLKSSWREGT